MNRNRTVLAAGGISALLLVGSAGLAFANGILTTRPVDRVGTFQMIQARLVPATEPPSVATTTRQPFPESSSTGSSSTSAVPLTSAAVTATTGAAVVGSTVPEAGSSGTHHVVAPAEPPRVASSVPELRPEPTRPAVSGSTVVHPKHDDDTDPTEGRGLDN